MILVRIKNCLSIIDVIGYLIKNGDNIKIGNVLLY